MEGRRCYIEPYKRTPDGRSEKMAVSRCEHYTTNITLSVIKKIPMKAFCIWAMNDPGENEWISACGMFHAFADEGPEENNFTYCPYCGGEIKVIESESEDMAWE